MAVHPPVVVHPPSPSGGRRVTIRGEIVGLAQGPADLLQFLRRAGAPEDAQLDNPALGTGGLSYATVASSLRNPACW
ncbi:hypothetical protein [Streptomyces sp. NEAU-S77]|uniref:hypothetical protein n=1 Tax=Streptomyces sp. NEAU-S77 TaxID=3411033 RepID=UPI003BA0E4DE